MSLPQSFSSEGPVSILSAKSSNKSLKSKNGYKDFFSIFFKPKHKKMFYFIAGLLLLFFILWVIRTVFKETFDRPAKLDSYFRKRKIKEKKELFDLDELKLQDESATNSKKKTDSKGEIQARKCAEIIFSKPFIKIRPTMLKNKVTGYNLELDIYNEELGLAIEYNGKQHYKYTPFFHKNYEHFLNQKYRDEIKRMLCQQNGIKLIEVHYLTPLEDMETVLRVEARKLGYDV